MISKVHQLGSGAVGADNERIVSQCDTISPWEHLIYLSVLSAAARERRQVNEWTTPPVRAVSLE